MTPLQSALLVNAIVLLATLGADLGVKAVSGRRLRRPLIAAAIIVPVFVHVVYTSGIGLTVQVAGAAAGVLVGLAAVSQMRVFRGADGQVATRAALAYALVWLVVAVGRSVFSYGASHWYGERLATFFVQHGAAPGDVGQMVTNGLVIMAVCALLTRTAGLMMRANAQRSGRPEGLHR